MKAVHVIAAVGAVLIIAITAWYFYMQYSEVDTEPQAKTRGLQINGRVLKLDHRLKQRQAEISRNAKAQLQPKAGAKDQKVAVPEVKAPQPPVKAEVKDKAPQPPVKAEGKGKTPQPPVKAEGKGKTPQPPVKAEGKTPPKVKPEPAPKP